GGVRTRDCRRTDADASPREPTLSGHRVATRRMDADSPSGLPWIRAMHKNGDLKSLINLVCLIRPTRDPIVESFYKSLESNQLERGAAVLFLPLYDDSSRKSAKIPEWTLAIRVGFAINLATGPSSYPKSRSGWIGSRSGEGEVLGLESAGPPRGPLEVRRRRAHLPRPSRR